MKFFENIYRKQVKIKSLLFATVIFGILLTFFTPVITGCNLGNKFFIGMTFLVILYWAALLLVVNFFVEQVITGFKKSASAKVIGLLRRLRHEFTNYFQVMYTMTQLEKLDRLHEYIQKVNQQNDKISRITKIEYPELSLFFMEQLLKYKEMEIDFEIKVLTKMERIKIEPIKLVSVLEEICELTGLESPTGSIQKVNWEITCNKRYYQIKLDLYDLSMSWRNQLEYLKSKFNDRLKNSGCQLEIWQHEERHLFVTLYIVKS